MFVFLHFSYLIEGLVPPVLLIGKPYERRLNETKSHNDHNDIEVPNVANQGFVLLRDVRFLEPVVNFFVERFVKVVALLNY